MVSTVATGASDDGAARLRVFELARELGIPASEIIARCRSEEVPTSAVLNRMSKLTPGWESVIRRWFAPDETPGA